MAVISHGSRKGGRLPPGPHRLTADQVAADQRRRLIDALVELAGEKTYPATTVADIVKRAEVSRKTFYAHFEDRDRLLLAAFDTTAPILLEQLRTASQRSGGPTRQLEAFMRSLCRAARESPETIALATMAIAAVADGLERRERLMTGYGELIDECLRTDGDRSHAAARARTGPRWRHPPDDRCIPAHRTRGSAERSRARTCTLDSRLSPRALRADRGHSALA